MIVHKRRTHSDWIFPEVPEGFDPNSNVREIFPEDEKNPVVEIDGFQITNEIDEDEEPIFCSREDPLVMPDYSNKCGFCELCKSTFEMIEDAVIHIHKRHGILGGSQHIMLDADRLLKGGYLSIPIDNVDTVITDAGKIDEATRESNSKEEAETVATVKESTSGNTNNFEVAEELCV